MGLYELLLEGQNLCLLDGQAPSSVLYAYHWLQHSDIYRVANTVPENSDLDCLVCLVSQLESLHSVVFSGAVNFQQKVV